MAEKKKFKGKTSWLIFWIIIFFPIAIGYYLSKSTGKSWFHKHYILTPLLVLVLLFLLLAIIGMFAGDSPDIQKDDKRSDSSLSDKNKDAIAYCQALQEITKDYLKAPTTAKFEDCSNADYSIDDYTTSIITAVDSENGFGAVVRTYIFGIASYENGELKSQYFKIGDQVIFDFINKAIATNTQNGITLSILGYKFEKAGDGTWGKITELSFTIDNKGSQTIYPNIYVQVSDKDITSGENIPSKLVELSEVIYEGDSVMKTVPVELPVSSLNNLKTISVSVRDYSTFFVKTDIQNVNLTQY